MAEANRDYHAQTATTKQQRAARLAAMEAIAEALRVAQNEIKDRIRREGRIKLSRVPLRELKTMAKELVMAEPERIARARAVLAVHNSTNICTKREGLI